MSKVCPICDDTGKIIETYYDYIYMKRILSVEECHCRTDSKSKASVIDIESDPRWTIT